MSQVERWQDRVNELGPNIEIKPMCVSHESFNKKITHFITSIPSSLITLDNSLENSLWITPVPFIPTEE